MKKQWVTQASLAAGLIVGANACANLIGLSDYEVDESSTSAGTSGAGGGGNAGTGGVGGGGNAGTGGVGGGGNAGTGGGGTAGSSAGTGGAGCIPTATPRQCASNGQCCEFSTNQASCVNFPDRGAFCTSRCTTNANCASNCCVTLDSGNKACAFPEFCSGTGGTAGTGGSAGGIGSPCTTSQAPCGSGTNAGTCNGRWCTKPCTTSVDCPGDTWCIRNNAGTNTCFVGCTTSTECAQFTGTTCQSGTDVSGLPVDICSLPSST